MASGTYNLNLLPHRFSIGRQGENRYRKVSFDIYKFVEPVFRDSTDGVIFLVGVFRRPDNTIYKYILGQIGNFYTKPSVNPNTCYNNYGCGGCNGCGCN